MVDILYVWSLHKGPRSTGNHGVARLRAYPTPRRCTNGASADIQAMSRAGERQPGHSQASARRDCRERQRMAWGTEHLGVHPTVFPRSLGAPQSNRRAMHGSCGFSREFRFAARRSGTKVHRARYRVTSSRFGARSHWNTSRSTVADATVSNRGRASPSGDRA
jgi:hypothetical protein